MYETVPMRSLYLRRGVTFSGICARVLQKGWDIGSLVLRFYGQKVHRKHDIPTRGLDAKKATKTVSPQTGKDLHCQSGTA